MKGDFSRLTFDSNKHYNRVLMQQGRVMLDADWNEQASILLNYMQTLGADLIGPHGGPIRLDKDGKEYAGFETRLTSNNNKDDLGIFGGHYYVDGILCQLEEKVDKDNDERVASLSYLKQPLYPLNDKNDKDYKASLPNPPYLVYLDVWERHITTIEDSNIREVALDGPDTATRAQIICQVKILSKKEDLEKVMSPQKDTSEPREEQVEALLEMIQRGKDEGIKDPELKKNITSNIKNFGWLNLGGLDELNLLVQTIEDKGENKDIDTKLVKFIIQSVKEQEGLNDPNKLEEITCKDFPLEKFRGFLQGKQPHLKAKSKEPDNKDITPCVTPAESRYRGNENQLYRVEVHHGGAVGEATFKWSRENGSVVVPWLETQGDKLIVSGIRDEARGFQEGDWVELINDDNELLGKQGEMVRLVKVEGNELSIDSTPTIAPKVKNAKVRRWNQREDGGVIKVTENQGWLELEDGIQIQFQPPKEGEANKYKTGDYWLIPARVATGDVLWPQTEDPDPEKRQPIPLPPHGIEHHYAPLALIKADNSIVDLRNKFEALATC